MSNEACACCGTGDECGDDIDAERGNGIGDERGNGTRDERGDDIDAGGSDGRWITERPVLDAALPADVRAAKERFLGAESVETLGDWVDELRRQAGTGSVSVDQLCHADEPTPHWGELDGDRYYFRCFYDAIALAELADEPVDVRTESPDGTVVEARATGDGDLEATPAGAALSLGVAADAGAASNARVDSVAKTGPDVRTGSDAGTGPDDAPTLEAVYEAVCPYVRAFPDRAAYEEWAEIAPAATVGVPLVDGVGVATRLVE